jgi:deoxyribodipyrimidine photo-lyase
MDKLQRSNFRYCQVCLSSTKYKKILPSNLNTQLSAKTLLSTILKAGKTRMKTAIWWIRRDLRLSDNPKLVAALDRAEVVIPLFILDPVLLASPYASSRRKAFLFDGLHALDASLRQRGSALVVRQGDPLAVFHNLRCEIEVCEIFAEADVSPYACRRDERVGRELPLTLATGLTVHPPETLRKDDGTPYTIYTPFSRMWRSLPFPTKPLTAPNRLPPLPKLLNKGVPIVPAGAIDSSFPAGEAEAQRRLAEFITSTIQRYAEERDRLDLNGTSGLSPYLRFGMLSARQAAWSARAAQDQAADATALRGAEIWEKELIWREFYIAILYHFPHVRRVAFRLALRSITWRNDPAEFAAWAEGRTGYPVVDAAMRQLNNTGWMHNRARMITASFLTKDLWVDWRWGEQYFMQHLLDGDPASNNGGWQWTAGTGTDAAPYFRVFNPVLQGMKYDPQGEYIRCWVPELVAVPSSFIHAPWKMPADVQRRVGCVIGKEYPAPIVDHAKSRQLALAVYRKVK